MGPPRCSLAVTPTPLQPLPRLGQLLGFDAGALWMKRDDLTGLAGGGNKARKLEYLVGDALARGCDTLLTGGAAQSNHVRMTAAAACITGLGCVAVLGGTPPDVADGNLLLDHLFGAELVWAGAYDAELLETTMAETCLRLTGEGRRPYEVPLGGASDVGTLGYVAAAGELAAEAPIGSTVYTATGTGGTQAGLVVGIGHHGRVRGIDVGAIDDVADRIAALVGGHVVARAPAAAGGAAPPGSIADRERVRTADRRGTRGDRAVRAARGRAARPGVLGQGHGGAGGRPALRCIGG